MRVSDVQRYRTYNQDIQDRLSNLTRIQEELGTGRSLFKPSESVVRSDAALRAEDQLATEAQFMRNIENGQGWVSNADSNLQSVVDLLTEIESLALAADNSSQNEDDRQNTALQLDQKLEELIRLVNSQSADRYLFGGHGTTVVPFSAERDENGRITGATANADTIGGAIYRRIGVGEDIQINVSGAALFQPVGEESTATDIFYVVANLRDTIANNNVPAEGSEETLSNTTLREQLGQIRERIAEQQTYLGSIGQRLESSLSRLKEHEVQLTDWLEQAQGTDVTDLATRAAVEDAAYNSLATLGAQVLQRSLIDYLG